MYWRLVRTVSSLLDASATWARRWSDHPPLLVDQQLAEAGEPDLLGGVLLGPPFLDDAELGDLDLESFGLGLRQFCSGALVIGLRHPIVASGVLELPFRRRLLLEQLLESVVILAGLGQDGTGRLDGGPRLADLLVDFLRREFELRLGLREQRFGHGEVFLGEGDLPRILLDHPVQGGFFELQGGLGHLPLGSGQVEVSLERRRIDLGQDLAGLNAVMLLDEHARDQAADLGREVDDVRLDEGVVRHRSGEPVECKLADHPDADHDPHQSEGPSAEDQEPLDRPSFGDPGHGRVGNPRPRVASRADLMRDRPRDFTARRDLWRFHRSDNPPALRLVFVDSTKPSMD